MPRSGAVARLAIGAAAAVTVWMGCAGDHAPTSASIVADAASGPVRIPPQPDTNLDAGPTCRDDCTARHPGGAPLNAAIDACWSTACAAPCIAGTAAIDAGADASAEGGDAGADASVPSPPACGAVSVATPTDACDGCTVASCCTPWAACFSNQDCADLNACLQLCTTVTSP